MGIAHESGNNKVGLARLIGVSSKKIKITVSLTALAAVKANWCARKLGLDLDWIGLEFAWVSYFSNGYLCGCVSNYDVG